MRQKFRYFLKPLKGGWFMVAKRAFRRPHLLIKPIPGEKPISPNRYTLLTLICIFALTNIPRMYRNFFRYLRIFQVVASLRLPLP